MTAPNPKLAQRGIEDEAFMSVADLKNYLAEIEMAKASKDFSSLDRAAAAKKEYLKKLSTPIEIGPERIRALLGRVKAEAERGNTEIMIGRFPVELCSDHGRAINNSEKDWPSTLTGVPRQAFEVWQSQLQPLGYHLKAMIVEWPNNLPGEVGLFITW
jgi:hypothetical protein